ncbi:hypothetical protein BLNAU_22387 [Blattamonas nauphoetae]|uniref:Serine-threonine/tyrosine-protein kinase catalytic domain-containing protein n=1 Tax=Blattamonas nauphoetae TaxID=2049346 RepID=A0ABQ9WT68_9EUKA|nr:hypothetical protein BLNAU_22387 [Blattamonas nauphoetae]
MLLSWTILQIAVISTLSHSLDNVLSLADLLSSNTQAHPSTDEFTLHANHRSYHACSHPLSSITLTLIGNNSDLHHSSNIHSTNTISKKSMNSIDILSVNNPMCILNVRNSSLSLDSWILHADEPNTIVSYVSSSHLMIRESEIISNVHQSPFVVSGSDGEQSTIIQIVSCSHRSKATILLPLVDIDRNLDCAEVGHSIVETSEEQNTRLHSERDEGDDISVIGSSLDISAVHFPIGSGPLFSFGMQNEERSDFDLANVRINTMLSSSSLLNVTSKCIPLSENENRFGSLMQQEIVGCCVSQCSNHDSGTTMLDVNFGGDLHNLNTSFSSCTRESNAVESYTNRNTTKTPRFAYPSGSTVTSATFTLCTFREMTGAFGDNDGGAAIYIRNTPASLSITQCSFHVCNVSGDNDDGGAVFILSPASNTNTLTVEKSSFTECKALGDTYNYGGSIFSNNVQQISITDSFFEKGEAQYDSVITFYTYSTSILSNCSFVDCETQNRGTISVYDTSTISKLAYLCFRGCSSRDEPFSKDIYFLNLTLSAVSSKITNCDSTSGAPNVYFRVTDTSDSTLVPQITSTPTVQTCTVTFSGATATVTVTTKEVIGGAMGILLEGCLVPRLVFVQFDTNGENSSIGTATVSSGANGILPSATYSLRSFVLPGDVGSQLFSAFATLKDANTTTITVNGVTLLEGSYSMLVQSTGSPINISLTRTDSTTLTGDAPLYPSSATGRLDWSTRYEIIKVENEKGGIKSEVRRINNLTFTTPSEQARIASVLSRSLNGAKDEVTIVFSGFSLPSGTGSIFMKPSDGAALVEGIVKVSKESECSAVFKVGWEEKSTHLAFEKTYVVQSASSGSVSIAIDSDVSFVVPSPPVITSFTLPAECSSDSFSLSVTGLNLPSLETFIVTLSSSISFEISFVDGTTGTGAIKAGLPSEMQFNTTYSIVSVTKGGEHVLLNQTSLKTPLGPTLKTVTTALNASNKNNMIFSLTGSRMMIGQHTLTFVEQGQSTQINVSVSIDTVTTGSGEEVVFGGSKLKYGTTYTISSLTSDTLHFALDGSLSFQTPDEPARIVGIWGELAETGNTTSITVRGRQIAKGSYTVRLNSADGISFQISFLDELSDERNSSISSVSIFGESAVLSFGMTYTLFSVTPSAFPSDALLIDADPKSFMISEPSRITDITIGSLSDDLRTTATLTMTGRALEANRDYEIHLSGVPKTSSSTATNAEADVRTIRMRTDSSNPTKCGSKGVVFYPHDSADLLFGYEYKVDSVSVDGSPILQNAGLSFCTPDEPTRIIGIWGELDSTGNTTSITVRGRQIAKGSYTVKLNSADGISFEISFLDDLSDERNSSVSSVSIFGESAVLSFGMTYTLFSVAPTSSPSASLLIDANPKSFMFYEPARVMSAFPVLSIDLQTVTVSISGRAFLSASFAAQLQITSPTTSSPFPTTSTRISNEELEMTLPILSGTPNITFGDKITIQSLTNGSSEIILDRSTFVIPQPPQVTSAECHFVSSLNTTITIELNGTDLPLHTAFLVRLDSGDSFEITFGSTLTGSTTEMAIGWPDTLQYSTRYRIVSIRNEETTQTIFVDDQVSFSTDPVPLAIVVFCDSSSFDSSRLCGTNERPCSSMDSAWKVGAMTNSLEVTFRIKLNTTLSNTVSCLARGMVVVEKGLPVEPTLRIPSSALMGESGMIVVSSDGLFELRDVDVVIESTQHSFVFLFASNSTLIIKDGSFVGPSNSTPSTLNEDDDDDADSSVCCWETGIMQLDNCSTRIDNTKFSNLQQGGINMKSGNLSIQTSAFSGNTPNPDLASAARRNVRCSEEGSLDIKTLNGGDGTPTDPSPWMSIETCSLSGAASKPLSPLFIPSLESGSKSSLNKSSKSFTVTICGDSLFPCDLSLEVFEVQKNKTERKNQLIDLTTESTTSFTESTITLSLPQSSLNLEASLEWRGRLVFGNGAQTNSSFVIQQNTADRFAQSVKDNMKWWIPLVVALAATAVLFIFIIVCCRRRQSKKKKEEKLLDPQVSEMNTLPPEKIEIVEDWKSNLPHDSLLGAAQSEGHFSLADTSNDRQHSWISGQETKEMSQAESHVDGVVMLEGDAMQLKPVNRKDTLYNRLHTTPKIPFAKLQTAKQIAHALTELQKVSPQLPLLSCLSSHFVLFDSNGNVELRLTDGKEGNQADLINGAHDPPIQPQPHTPVPLHAHNRNHLSHIHWSELNTHTLTTQPSQAPSQGEGFELLRWRAPEATQNVGEPAKEIDHVKAAVFSLGLILFEIESETVPLREMDAVNANRHLGTGNLPKMELIQNVGLHELITSCLSLDPSLRPNLDSIESKLDSVEFSNPANQNIEFC